jgi:hypothetical protein
MPVAPSTPLYVEVVTARGAVWPARFMARSERRFALVRWMAYKEGHDTDQLEEDCVVVTPTASVPISSLRARSTRSPPVELRVGSRGLVACEPRAADRSTTLEPGFYEFRIKELRDDGSAQVVLCNRACGWTEDTLSPGELRCEPGGSTVRWLTGELPAFDPIAVDRSQFKWSPLSVLDKLSPEPLRPLTTRAELLAWRKDPASVISQLSRSTTCTDLLNLRTKINLDIEAEWMARIGDDANRGGVEARCGNHASWDRRGVGVDNGRTHSLWHPAM